MNEQKRNIHANDYSPRERACPRSEDLVTYLYGEAGQEEAQSFGQHVTTCATCREELAAFGQVRTALGEWRSEAMSDAPSLASSLVFERAAADEPFAREIAATSPTRRRSAVEALRQFFALSPVWLRAGTALAALVLCVLVALVFARTEIRREASGLSVRFGTTERVVRETVTVPVENHAQQARANEARLNEMLAERERQLETLRAQLQQQQDAQAVEYRMAANEPAPARRATRASASERGAARASKGKRQATRRFDIANNEESLPRLYDLLSEVN